jgi:thiamine-monophosphate kinase
LFELARMRRLCSLARRHGVAIVGGETTTNPGGLLISVALLGFVGKSRALLRRGALPDDALFVTGELGVRWRASTSSSNPVSPKPLAGGAVQRARDD